MDRLLKADELVRVSGLARTTIYKLAADGMIPCVKLGARIVRFPEAAVQRWIESRTTGGGQGAGAGDAGAR